MPDLSPEPPLPAFALVRPNRTSTGEVYRHYVPGDACLPGWHRGGDNPGESLGWSWADLHELGEVTVLVPAEPSSVSYAEFERIHAKAIGPRELFQAMLNRHWLRTTVRDEQIRTFGYDAGFTAGRADMANDLDAACASALRDAARDLHQGAALGGVGICAPDCPGCALVRRADEIEDADVPLDTMAHEAGGAS